MAVSFYFDNLKKPQGFIKFVEVLLGIICISLAANDDLDFGVSGSSNKSSYDATRVVVITFGGYLIYSGGMLICYLTDKEGHKTLQECLLNPLACIMYIASGALFCNTYSDSNFPDYKDYKEKGLAIGALAIINGVAYLIDSYFCFKGRGIINF